MTRFDATTPDERRALIVDAIAAHRSRSSPHVTLEADVPPPDTETGPAWIQYRAQDGLINLDCTDAELDRLSGVLDAYPECTIVARERPEEAAGTNVRIEAYTGDDRIAALVEELFRSAYGYEASVRLWAASV